MTVFRSFVFGSQCVARARLALTAALSVVALSACNHLNKTAEYEHNPGIVCEKYNLTASQIARALPYRVKASTGERHRCDISELAVAVSDDGNFRDIYGPERIPATDPRRLAVSGSSSLPVLFNLIDKAQRLDPGEPLKILMFAHGGLVTHLGAVRSAEELAPAILADGYHPVFLIWNSDFPRAYRERLCCVRDGVREGSESDPRNLFAQSWFSTLRVAGDLGGGIARAPENYTKQGIRFYSTALADKPVRYRLSHEPLLERDDQQHRRDTSERDKRLDAVNQAAKNGGLEQVAVSGFTSWDHPDFLTSLHNSQEHCRYFLVESPGPNCPVAVLPPFTEEEKLNANVFNGLKFAHNTITLPVKLTATTLTTGGGQAWHNMVRRTRLAFSENYAPSSYFTPLKLESTPLELESDNPCAKFLKVAALELDAQVASRYRKDSAGAFDKFFRLLQLAYEKECFNSRLNAPPAPRDVQIYLFGHSMGGFIVNETISRYPDLPFTNVTHMAAANSTREFDLASRAYLNTRKAEEKPAAFFSLVLHPTAESRESNYGSTLPLGSLLEWIDEYFEGPRTFGDRTWGKWNNAVISSSALDTKVRDRLAIRVFPLTADSPPGTCAASPVVNDKPKLCHPLKHGEFTQFTFWRPTYVCDDPARNPLCWARFTRSSEFCSVFTDAAEKGFCEVTAQKAIDALN